MLRTNFPHFFRRLHRDLGLACLVGGMLTACRPSAMPKLVIELPTLAPQDTLAYVTYAGEAGQHTDTLRHFSSSLTLYPDTARYHRLSFTHAQGEAVLFYAWVKGAWRLQESVAPPPSIPTQAEDFYARDIRGMERTLSDLYRHHPVSLLFISPETLRGVSKQEQVKRSKALKVDSITWVLLYPTASDSTARRLMRQDSLQGIAFSDSLGIVSDLRARYRIVDKGSAVHLLIDTLGQVKRL